MSDFKEQVQTAVLDNHFVGYGDRSYAQVINILENNNIPDEWVIGELFEDWHMPTLAKHMQSIVDSVLHETKLMTSAYYQSAVESRNNG